MSPKLTAAEAEARRKEREAARLATVRAIVPPLPRGGRRKATPPKLPTSVTIGARLPIPLVQALDSWAAEAGLTRSVAAVYLIARGLAEHPGDRPDLTDLEATIDAYTSTAIDHALGGWPDAT